MFTYISLKHREKDFLIFLNNIPPFVTVPPPLKYPSICYCAPPPHRAAIKRKAGKRMTTTQFIDLYNKPKETRKLLHFLFNDRKGSITIDI